MDLTSYQRMLRYLPGRREDNMTNDVTSRRDLLTWVSPVSACVESYLNRDTELKGREEYFDLDYGQKQFYPNGFPVVTIGKVYYDSTGLWDGGETELTDPWIGTDGRSVNIPSAMDESGSRMIKIQYTGGLANHGTRSTFVIATTTGTWHTYVYVVGTNSGACGIVRSSSSTALTVEVLYGTFEIGEPLTEYDTEAAVGSSDASGTLSSKTTTALCESCPEITLGAEMQIRYMWKNKDGFENAGVSKDGASTRQANVQSLGMPLQPEVQTMLTKYRRISL